MDVEGGGWTTYGQFTGTVKVRVELTVTVLKPNWSSARKLSVISFSQPLFGVQLGAFIYAMRVPERWKPGAFDIVLHSHQLFHLCVVAAALVHYRGILILLHWRDSTGGCDLPLTATS